MKIVLIIAGIIVGIIILAWLGFVVVTAIAEGYEQEKIAKQGIIDNRYVTIYEQKMQNKIAEEKQK